MMRGRKAGEARGRNVTQPIDLAHLERQTLGDKALQREVLALFAEQAVELGRLLGDAGTEERRRLAHTIKGAAGGVGAFAVADAAARIEREPDDEALLLPLGALIDEACGFVAALAEA